ncbi:hypothetical protein [Asticcacaulis sp. EMRT-3]|uniref:hypothetical protein n=1 Tax=Asticcacaulis sp. EMRT-3 TaxID=3040349 RepID=UPI0024AEEC49|nr:hypothetical protein [Asticcacaulis sp. EMRT-3]MDI7774589.1 hypothetical protein [Asticcacaulis sp. EMRT-3]
MEFRHRRAKELEEGESYYVSMTDMMVGVVFIFIIMLAYFALNFHKSTEMLTSAKDAQTTALLQVADALKSQQATIQIDHKNHVVCVPGQVLADDGVNDPDPHCFAYTAQTPKESSQSSASLSTAADNAAFMTSVGDDIDKDKIPANTNIDTGTLTFTADQLFENGSTTLSANGQSIAGKVAATLAARLPCYASGAPATNCETSGKMSVVNIVASSSFNAFTPEGRAQQALALERSVAFHDALIADQPVLGKLRAGPNGPALLQVASVGQSVEGGNDSQSLSVQFHMAQ